MALEMGMNLVCSVLEEVVMCVCQYLFMSANAQTIHRKKIWYFFGFTALGASVYGAAFLTGLTGNLWIGIQIQLTGVLLLGILLFHRKIGSLLLDLFVNILLILSIEVGIFLGNYLLAQGAFENLVWYGNVTMLFKMFFMIPVTSAAVMWRKRQQETEMGNLQILLLLLLPLFSVTVSLFTDRNGTYLYGSVWSSSDGRQSGSAGAFEFLFFVPVWILVPFP